MRPRHLLVLASGVVFTAGCSGGWSVTPGSASWSFADGGTESPSFDAGSAGGDASEATDSGAAAASPADAGTQIAALPLVTPPVKAAAPVAFGGTGGASGGFTTQDVPMGPAPFSDIASRFFLAGPTDIYFLLGAIDDRVRDFAQAQAGGAPCLAQAPVAYTIAPFGESVTFYAQCYQSLGARAANDPGFVQFGQMNGVTYYYAAVGASWTAAIVTPVPSASPVVPNTPPPASGDAAPPAPNGDDAGMPDGPDAAVVPNDVPNAPNDAAVASNDAANAPNDAPDASPPMADAGAPATNAPAPAGYIVHAWSGVGYQNVTSCGAKNGFDDCSYGVVELVADSGARTFEMSVAGIGFGYCGAQLKSDGARVYGVGSPDMGLTCGQVGEFCFSASDATTPATCDGAVKSFALPALGRTSSVGPNAGGPGADAGAGAAWGASQYPGEGSNDVVLDGTATDSLSFGPTSPTAGVGAL